MSQGHILWPITTQFNHFLDRYQRAREADSQLAATTQAINELANELDRAIQEQRSPKLVRRQTPLDAVILTMQGANITSEKGGLLS